MDSNGAKCNMGFGRFAENTLVNSTCVALAKCGLGHVRSHIDPSSKQRGAFAKRWRAAQAGGRLRVGLQCCCARLGIGIQADSHRVPPPRSLCEWPGGMSSMAIQPLSGRRESAVTQCLNVASQQDPLTFELFKKTHDGCCQVGHDCFFVLFLKDLLETVVCFVDCTSLSQKFRHASRCGSWRCVAVCVGPIALRLVMVPDRDP